VTCPSPALTILSPSLLVVEDVAARLHMSKRSIHERTRRGMIPHRRPAGTRRCLFIEAELEAWLNGARLEMFETRDGGRVVRPVVDAPPT
jgi:predicted DNA-binding transcriptional regulator AlpA